MLRQGGGDARAFRPSRNSIAPHRWFRRRTSARHTAGIMAAGAALRPVGLWPDAAQKLEPQNILPPQGDETAAFDLSDQNHISPGRRPGRF